MNELITITGNVVPYSFPAPIDYLALLILVLNIPNIVAFVWKQFDKGRNAKGAAPSLFGAFMIIVLMYMFNYRAMISPVELQVLSTYNSNVLYFKEEKEKSSPSKEEFEKDMKGNLMFNYRGLLPEKELKIGYIDRSRNDTEISEDSVFKKNKVYAIYYESKNKLGQLSNNILFHNEMLTTELWVKRKFPKEEMDKLYETLKNYSLKLKSENSTEKVETKK